MYKFPSDFEAKTFVGRSLEMVCFTQNQIYLHFNGAVSVAIESSVQRYLPNSERAEIIKIPAVRSDLVDLLEHKIENAHIEVQQILILRFETGDIMKFSDLSENFESYHFDVEGRKFVL